MAVYPTLPPSDNTPVDQNDVVILALGRIIRPCRELAALAAQTERPDHIRLAVAASVLIDELCAQVIQDFVTAMALPNEVQ